MPLQERHIQQLQAIYFKREGKILPEQEAWAMAHRLLNLVKLLSQTDGESSEMVRTFPVLPPKGDH